MAKKIEYSEKVINAFINNMKVTDICKETGLSVNTIKKYKKDPELQKILSQRRQESVTEAVEKMQSYMTKGVDVLLKIIEDEENAPQVRVNALQLLFNQCRDWTTTTEIQQRLILLEESRLIENDSY